MKKLEVNNDPCLENPNCIPGITNVPLLKNVRKGMIDPDTPQDAMTKTAVDGSTLNLVVSLTTTLAISPC